MEVSWHDTFNKGPCPVPEESNVLSKPFCFPGLQLGVTEHEVMLISKIQLVVYYQCYVLWPTSSNKCRLFGGKKELKSSFN